MLIDGTLELQLNEEIEAVRILKIALLCVQSSPVERPDMGLVVAMLHGRLDVNISRLTAESSFCLRYPRLSKEPEICRILVGKR